MIEPYMFIVWGVVIVVLVLVVMWRQWQIGRMRLLVAQSERELEELSRCTCEYPHEIPSEDCPIHGPAMED